LKIFVQFHNPSRGNPNHRKNYFISVFQTAVEDVIDDDCLNDVKVISQNTISPIDLEMSRQEISD